MKQDNGFSLVELIIVVAIMAILVGVLAPQYVKYVERSKASADENSAEMLLGIAYAMIADQTVFDQLNDGDTIEFETTGITPSNLPAMKDSLDEHIPDWTTTEIGSREHSKGYRVIFTKTASDVFYVKGEWVP